MNANEVLKIKNLIKEAEIESAKLQGVIENIKKEWLEEFGTDDIVEIKKILDEKKQEYDKISERLESLYQKLLNSYDWEKLSEELN